MADIWANVVTAASTLIAGFGGVLLTQRHTARQSRWQRLDQVRAVQREALIDVIYIGAEWERTARQMSPVLFEMDPPEGGDVPRSGNARPDR